MHHAVAEYVVRLVLATREPAAYGLAELASTLDFGASPRATLGLVAAARALALLRGREYVLPEDVAGRRRATCSRTGWCCPSTRSPTGSTRESVVRPGAGRGAGAPGRPGPASRPADGRMTADRPGPEQLDGADVERVCAGWS